LNLSIPLKQTKFQKDHPFQTDHISNLNLSIHFKPSISMNFRLGGGGGFTPSPSVEYKGIEEEEEAAVGAVAALGG
jgi:hypothetical protein